MLNLKDVLELYAVLRKDHPDLAVKVSDIAKLTDTNIDEVWQLAESNPQKLVAISYKDNSSLVYTLDELPHVTDFINAMVNKEVVGISLLHKDDTHLLTELPDASDQERVAYLMARFASILKEAANWFVYKGGLKKVILLQIFQVQDLRTVTSKVRSLRREDTLYYLPSSTGEGKRKKTPKSLTTKPPVSQLEEQVLIVEHVRFHSYNVHSVVIYNINHKIIASHTNVKRLVIVEEGKLPSTEDLTLIDEAAVIVIVRSDSAKPDELQVAMAKVYLQLG